MSANVIQLERIFRRSWDWSTRELSEFYRVESALIQAGLKIDTERGLTDEGDPWFAFCRSDDGEVVVHIARIGGVYVLAGPSYEGIATGSDIAALVRDLVTRHSLIQMRGGATGQSAKIFLHPAALLIAVVATAFFKTTEARALSDEQKQGSDERGPGADARGGAVAPRSENVSMLEVAHKTVVMDAVQTAVILSAVASVLQTSSSVAAEVQGISVVAAAPDFLDFAVISPPAQQHLVSASGSPGFALQLEAHQFEAVHEVHGPSNVALLPVATSQVAMAEALPLITVLWDVATAHLDSTKVVVHDAGVVPTNISPAAVTLQSPIVTFKMALAAGSHEDLPVVQAAKISYTPATATTAQSVPDTQVITKPDQLPTALVSALKDATHSAIDGQPVVAADASFANNLFHSLTDHTAGTETQVPTKTATALLDNPAAAHPVTAPPEKPAAAQSVKPNGLSPAQDDHSPTLQPSNGSAPAAQKSPDVAGLLLSFFDHVNWSMTGDGNGVVIYDIDALQTHPDGLKSVSFDFADGSTLSLIGLPADLPHLTMG